MAIIFLFCRSFIFDETVFYIDSFSYVDFNISYDSTVDYVTVFNNLNIWIIYYNSFHGGNYRKNIRKCNWLFRLFSIKYMHEYRDTRNRSRSSQWEVSFRGSWDALNPAWYSQWFTSIKMAYFSSCSSTVSVFCVASSRSYQILYRNSREASSISRESALCTL